MYIIAILGVILSVYLMLAENTSGLNIYYYLDFWSVLFILIIVIPILAAAGLLKDFNNAFKLTLGKKEAVSLRELKRAKSAVELTMKCALYTGAVSTLIGCVQAGTMNTEWMAARMDYSAALISLLYGFIICLILFPISSRLDHKISDFMESEE